jgi:signal peptidase
MEPSYYRGDILFLTNYNTAINVGDIVVYQQSHEIPIVHRVITVQGHDTFLTKGDNNQVDDRGLYDNNAKYLRRKDILGKVRASLPYVGILTILLNDYPTLKFVVIGGMLILVLISKDPQS